MISHRRGPWAARKKAARFSGGYLALSLLLLIDLPDDVVLEVEELLVDLELLELLEII